MQTILFIENFSWMSYMAPKFFVFIIKKGKTITKYPTANIKIFRYEVIRKTSTRKTKVTGARKANRINENFPLNPFL